MTPTLRLVEWALVMALAVAAAAWDVRTRRIPNALVIVGAAGGLLLGALQGGLRGCAMSLLGMLTGLALFLPLFALRGMGGGDVKLLAAFGASLGPMGALVAAFWASIAGGILAIVVAAARGYLGDAFRNLGAMVAVWRTVGPSPIPSVTLENSRGPRLAYAVPIGIGALVALGLRHS